MAELVRASHPTIRLIVLCSLVIGLVAIGAGAYFVYLGSLGLSEVHLFGKSLKSENVGVSCVFFGAIVIIVAGLTSLKTITYTVGLEVRMT
jgi:hypothetical protein